MDGQLELFADQDYYDSAYENPMVVQYGKGPDEKCKTCANLFYKEYDKRYYKCKMRGDTNGPGTDHRVGYHACSLYSKRKE